MSRKLQEKRARREAEEARRKQQQREARRRNLVTIGIAVLVGVVVVGLIYVEQSKDSQATGVARGQANCSDVKTFADEGNKHVPDGTDVTYASVPPTSGNHWGDPAETGFYPPESVGEPPEERLVHNLEHGQIVLWYSPSAPRNVIQSIEDYLDAQSGEQTLALLAAPYEGLPEGTNFAMSAWTAMQSCERFSPSVADSFREEFQGKGPEQVGVPTFTPEDDG